MPLQILKHKSWHVWRRDNLDRVEKDEREYEASQIAHRTSKRQNDREERLAHLRSVANASTSTSGIGGQTNGTSSSSKATPAAAVARGSGAPGKHVVLFSSSHAAIGAALGAAAAGGGGAKSKTNTSSKGGQSQQQQQQQQPNPDELGELLKNDLGKAWYNKSTAAVASTHELAIRVGGKNNDDDTTEEFGVRGVNVMPTGASAAAAAATAAAATSITVVVQRDHRGRVMTTAKAARWTKRDLMRKTTQDPRAQVIRALQAADGGGGIEDVVWSRENFNGSEWKCRECATSNRVSRETCYRCGTQAGMQSGAITSPGVEHREKVKDRRRRTTTITTTRSSRREGRDERDGQHHESRVCMERKRYREENKKREQRNKNENEKQTKRIRNTIEYSVLGDDAREDEDEGSSSCCSSSTSDDSVHHSRKSKRRVRDIFSEERRARRSKIHKRRRSASPRSHSPASHHRHGRYHRNDSSQRSRITKKKRKKKKRSMDSCSGVVESKKRPTAEVELLRAERLRREMHERERTRAVLFGTTGHAAGTAGTVMEERKGDDGTSAFDRRAKQKHIARKNRKHH